MVQGAKNLVGAEDDFFFVHGDRIFFFVESHDQFELACIFRNHAVHDEFHVGLLEKVLQLIIRKQPVGNIDECHPNAVWLLDLSEVADPIDLGIGVVSQLLADECGKLAAIRGLSPFGSVEGQDGDFHGHLVYRCGELSSFVLGRR